MPKSKKKKRQDFQKVKLKVGKRLPKGDNVTNLSFKTRQIQLTQKIKDDDGQGFVTKAKQNVQELLRQCDHHSSSSRLNAVMGLRELWVSNYSEMMVPTNVYGYAAILKKLSCLLIDTEVTVRHAVVNLFKVILHKITRDPTSPAAHSDRLLGGNLFAHLHAFLCCAMNHVHEDVRLDALLLYDALLETCPTLLVQQTGGLLRNLAGLLSTPSQGHVGSRGDKVTQKLSLNPESRLTVMQFRVRVLSRIKRTLMAAINDKLVSNTQSKVSPDRLTVWSLHDDYYEKKGKQNTMLSSDLAVRRFSTIANSGSYELDDYITNPTSLESFINQCVPVLIQCWKEASVDNDSQNESVSLLTSGAVEVISLIVSIIQILFTLALSDGNRAGENRAFSKPLVPPEEITKNYQTSLEQLMMGGFPYSAQLEASAGKKKGNKKKSKDTGIHTEASLQTSLTVLNIGICYIMSSFCTDHNLKLSKIWCKKISHFTILSMKEAPNVDQCKTIVRIMKNIFFNPHTAGHFIKVYKVALKWYNKLSPKSQHKKLLYEAFAQMGQRWDGWSKNRHDMGSMYRFKENQAVEDILVDFFGSLPELTLTVHSVGDEKWTLSLLTLMSHGHVRLYCKPFGDLLTQVLDPIQGLFTSSNELIQQRVCFLIASGTQFSKENLRQLLNLIRCPREKPLMFHRKSWSCVGHALHAMFANIRTSVPLKTQEEFNQMTSEEHQRLSDYLRFLFSLQLGFTGEELDQISPVSAEGKGREGWLSIDFSVVEAEWERHLSIVEIVAREIALFSLPPQPAAGYKDGFTFMSNFEHFWTQTFAKRGSMHILSVTGLSYLVLHASHPHIAEQPGQELLSLASLSIATALTGMYQQDSVAKLPGSLAWEIKAELTRVLSAVALCSPLLGQVMDLLKKRAEGVYGGSDIERQAAKSAQDFLLTDETLRHKLQT